MNTNESHADIGILGFYGLLDWWNESFTNTQKDYILKKYKPMSGNKLLEGEFSASSSSSVINFLTTLQTYFTALQDETISEEILLKAESYVEESLNILDIHFLYGSLVEHYYKKRLINSRFYELAIVYCQKQINISNGVKEKFLLEFSSGKLPRHLGFVQFAIILEKEKKYEEAIIVCEIAENMGWNADWYKRIKRLKMKVNSK